MSAAIWLCCVVHYLNIKLFLQPWVVWQRTQSTLDCIFSLSVVLTQSNTWLTKGMSHTYGVCVCVCVYTHTYWHPYFRRPRLLEDSRANEWVSTYTYIYIQLDTATVPINGKPFSYLCTVYCLARHFVRLHHSQFQLFLLLKFLKVLVLGQNFISFKKVCVLWGSLHHFLELGRLENILQFSSWLSCVMYQSRLFTWNCDKEIRYVLNEFLDWHWSLSPNTSSLLFHFLYCPLVIFPSILSGWISVHAHQDGLVLCVQPTNMCMHIKMDWYCVQPADMCMHIKMDWCYVFSLLTYACTSRWTGTVCSAC